ncbi:MAG: BTAD domain-containing putative transcriptional regulator, partial [Chloroflexota bacterium]
MTKQVKLFGLFEIEEDGETISAQNSPKGVALLAYLLVTRRQQSREAIADLLWEASSTAHGLQNLRKHLSRVRKWLPELHIDRQRVGIKPDASLDVDLYQLEEGSSHPDLYERAKTVLLYRGELLSGFYLSDAPEFNAWLTIERERLHRKMGSRLGELCGELFEAQLWDLGVQTASHWVTLDELDEESSQWLMRFLDAQGNMSAAKAEFDRLASALKRELGIQPSEQTAQLYDQLISDRETIPEDNQPLVKVPPPASTRIDWGEAPTTEQFVGREAEIEQLSTWIIDESARVVTVLGIGGQGKTSLAVALVQRQANQFETIFWRSLVNAPPLSLVLREYINFLDPQNGAQLSDSIGEQLNTLRDLLQSGRHLLVLDNLETILDKDQIGRLQPPYQAYEDLFTLIASTRYGTTLLMTSRESPTSVRQLDQKFRGIYEHALVGLDWEAGFSILQSEGSALSSEASEALTLRYSGNPLALKLVSKTIEAFYFGDVEGFLADSGAIFDDIRVVLEQQFERLSPLEQEILYWLAVRREATIPSDLEPLLTTPLRGGGLINGLQRLERRSLLERDGRGFALQNVITEFLTDRIVLSIGNEFQSKRFDLLSRHALTLSDSKEYIRQSQARILLGGVAQELAKLIDYRDEIKAACAALLDEARQDARLQEGYLPGNLLNLLIHMGIDLKGMDFSDLHLRQLYLRDVWLHDVDFSFSTFDDAVFSETFGALFCIAYHPSGQALAMGTRDGDIYAWGIDRGRPTELLKRFPHHPDDPNNRSLPTHVIRTVAFSPDGRLLAAGSYNYAVRIWDYAESKVLHTLETGSEHPGVITFSPDGQLLATGYAGFGFALWEVESGALRKVHYGHEATLKGCAFHPDGELVATCSDDFTVGLWEVESGRLIQQLKGHSNIIGAIAWSSDGRWLATGSRDHTIRLWDMEGLDAITSKVLTGHNNDVTHIAFHGSSAYLISGSVDHTVRIWQVPTGEPRHLLQQHTDSVYGVAASPDGRTLASGSVDLSLTIWEFQSGQPIYRLQGSGRWSRALDIDPSGGRVASGSAD